MIHDERTKKISHGGRHHPLQKRHGRQSGGSREKTQKIGPPPGTGAERMELRSTSACAARQRPWEQGSEE